MLMLMLAALSMLCMVGPAHAVARQCKDHSNGCSIPGDLDYFFKSQFTPACDRHDVCYSCGTSYGMSRNDCDMAMYRHTKDICRRLRKRSLVKAAERSFCHVVSRSWYDVINWFGASHFNSGRAPGWCRYYRDCRV